ncbi:pentapeptide repeat-containing protein [Streptomyces sp. NPDC093084]|uniref:pentapeptide repeat-containing protein n=1 Tax=Streptomyces sp. NPDC093084 TaxID=3155197 RepID=UPI00343A1BA3
MTTAAPSWPHCGEGAAPGGPFAGCTGITVTATGRCLRHAEISERDAYLASLAPGADLDLRGTTVGPTLLSRILTVTTDPTADRPTIGTARFDSATFTGSAQFRAATFTGWALFDSATFTGSAGFESATFTEPAGFRAATFAGWAWFDSATFTQGGWFDSATFIGDARFSRATFTGPAQFGWATFIGDAMFASTTFAETAWFESATFAADTSFVSAVFEDAWALGPLVCAGAVELSGAVFKAAVTVEIVARQVLFDRTRWAQPATVRLRYADVDLSDTVAEYSVTVAARTRPFKSSSGSPVDESVLSGAPDSTDSVRVRSLRGVDAAQLVLTDVNLGRCLFAGAIHLDQLRLEGDCRFPGTPGGVHRQGRLLPVRHTRRLVLAEEHHWRHSLPRAVPGWQTPPTGADILQPRAMAAIYRALRKAHEDSSNEPGAADFYYGEMGMRRADPRTPRAERGLLTAYWALSGYGLRATRALAWLLLAMTGTMLVMTLWGLPQHDTSILSTGTLTGQRITLTTDNPEPQNPTGPLGDRLTTGRFEKSLRVVVNSVIFRASGQDLTTAGTYTEMASRLTEPILLGLAALAVRGRIKR